MVKKPEDGHPDSLPALDDAAEYAEVARSMGGPSGPEVVTLPDGRVVMVIVADAFAGGPPPAPAEPQSHVDVWWWSERGEWTLSQTVNGEPAAGAGYSLPVDEEQFGLPYVYSYTAPHTFGCEDHRPTDPPEFP